MIVICCLLLLGVGYFVKTGFKYMQVVGKWTDSYSNGETVAEFFWDGTCIIDDFTGTYSLKNGKMYLVSNNYRKSGVMFYEKNGNVLILSEENGDNSTLLIRVK